MAMLRKALGSTIIAAMLATSATPALARPGHGWGNPHGWGGYGRHWRHRDRDDDFGNFLLGAVIAGGIIAIASSAAKAKRERDGNGVVYGGGVYSDKRRDKAVRDNSPRASRGWSAAEREAANLCADSAEALASKRSVNAKVDDIDFVDRDNEGYRVEGRLEGGHSFNCGVRDGELTYIQFGDRVALR